MASVELERVDKIYPGGIRAVADLDLEVRDGELLVLLGPSGCGKSTILRMVAGLEPLTSGRIRIGDRRVDREAPDRRDVAMVFQSYALYGHMTVRENIEFPLRMRKIDRAERRRRAEETASLLQLEELLDVRPAALSGGQQQRVAMGRALVRRPAAFLLDEPLSNLDARLRTQLREEIGRVQRRLGVTTLHVTHDQVEALSLGDRVAVLRGGRLQQVGSGQDLYDWPGNTFVAAFLGRPGMNLLRARLTREDGVLGATLAGTEARIVPPWLGAAVPADTAAASEVAVGIRPEDVRIAPEGGGAVSGTVRSVEDLGSERIVHLETAIPLVDPTANGAHAVDESPSTHLFAVRVDRHEAAPSLGALLHVGFRPEGLRVFSSDGRALRPRS